MTASDALLMLWKATLATSLAALLLMALPALLRRRFGAGVAYAAWLLLPVAMAAACLPASDRAPAAPTQAIAMRMPARIVAVQEMVAQAVAAPVKAAPQLVMWQPWLLALWVCGALATGLWLGWRQRRFERGLGRLSRGDDGLWRSPARIGLPALLGVAPARIVLPDDFESRYDAHERTLMLAHERAHARRGDPLANFVAACLRTLFWFNPLVLVALARFRHDQELACDEAVLLDHPESRRAYGEAMLKTLMADRLAPLGCHWGLSHPMKDRLMQLKREIPRGSARSIGAAMVGVMAVGTAFAVWAAQSARDVATAAATQTAMQDNDGVFIALKVVPGDADAATQDALPVDTSWLKPGQRIPAGLNWQDGAGAPRIAVGLVYDVERDANGGMTALISLAEKDDAAAGLRPSMAGAQIIRVPVAAGATSHYERVVGRRGTRIRFDVRRAPGPCDGEVAALSQNAADGKFQCFPGLKPLAKDEPSPQTLIPAPAYPQQAMQSSVNGEVRLNLLVARDGTVKDAKVVSSTPAGVFDAAALRAARNWRLKPRYEHGVAVEEWRQVPISFNVD